jgi:hypothetical protein
MLVHIGNRVDFGVNECATSSLIGLVSLFGRCIAKVYMATASIPAVM